MSNTLEELKQAIVEGDDNVALTEAKKALKEGNNPLK